MSHPSQPDNAASRRTPRPRRPVLYCEADTDTEDASDSLSTPRVRTPVAPPPVASPEAVAAEKRAAHDRARAHLDRWARRRRQPQSDWMQRPLQDLPVCVIDLETTGGGDASDDEILEVGAVTLRGRAVVREFSSLVDPQRPITRGAQAVHRITATDIIGAPRIDTLLPWILELAHRRVLVFHNAGFDHGFLQRALLEAGQEPLRQPVIDTVVVARRLLGGRCGLGHLGRRLALTLPHAHRALADAQLTAQVWLELVEILEDAGATRLAEVPGVVTHLRRPRRRRRPPQRELLQLLRDAIARRRPLQVHYRATRGGEPLSLQVQPQRILHNRFCRVVDVDTGSGIVLDFDRIDRCHPCD